MRIVEVSGSANTVSSTARGEQKPMETKPEEVGRENAPSQEGSEWVSSRRTGRRTRNAGSRGSDAELRVDTRPQQESKSPTEEQDQHEARGASHTSEPEPVIPVTVTSLTAETKNADAEAKTKRAVPAEYVAGKEEGEDTEDDIALLEYLSGAESDYYELDRASRKGEDGDNPTPIMSLSPRSHDESLGTPGSPGGLLSVEEHGGFGLSPIRYTTVTRRTMVHAQEAPRQVSTHVVESPPAEGKATDVHEVTETTEARPTTEQTSLQPSRPSNTVPDGESEWVACETEDGVPYYYNRRTLESQWTLPVPSSTGARTFRSDELFEFAGAYELSDAESRQLSIMLHSGMDLQAVNANGFTPLHLAAKMGNEQAAALLVYYGAKTDARALRDQSTALMLACRSESEAIVKILIEANASLSACDSNGDTALHVAVYTGNESLVMCVLSACEHPLLSQKNNEGETALHIAAKCGYLGVMRNLLAYGASIKDEDAQGRTPLILSILENHVECVQLLQSVESSTTPASTPSSSAPPYSTPAAVPDPRQQTGERDALAVLHSYLFQLLASHSASEAQTVYQLIEDVRGQISSLNSTLQVANAREVHYRDQLDEMSALLTSTTEELKKEKAQLGDIQTQLSLRQLELEASRVSHRALTSRCELLESIARNAQEKLGRERLEHSRYEDVMQEKLHQSLQENASVIESCQQLQARWGDQQHVDKRLGRRDSQGFYESQEAAHFAENESDKYRATTADSTASYASGNQPRERELSDQQLQQQYYYSYSQPVEQYHPESVETPRNEVPEGLPVKPQFSPPASPSRVNAVWNRFFENVGHVEDTHESVAPGGFTGLNQAPNTYPTGSLVFDAVRKSDLQKLQEILLRGVSPNQRDVAEKGTPLHLACELGDIDSVMLLCEFTADLEARDETGNTPLLAACLQGNFACAKFLLQSAVSLRAVNENGDSALHLAAWDGSIDCVMILLEYGVDPMRTNRFGLTALGNMKTRSPMRHKFDDLPEDHPMRRTIVVLEEAELQRRQVMQDEASVAPEDATLTRQESTDSSKRASWTQWLLGFRGASPIEGSAAKPELGKPEADASTSATTGTDEIEMDSDDADELSSYEESKLALGELQYEPLTPPPEVEEALRRAKADQQNARAPPSPSELAPTHPLTRQDLLRHTKSTRGTKPQPPPAPSKVRSRYVDTFNAA